MTYQSLEACISARQTATECDSPSDSYTNHKTAGRRGGVDLARNPYDRERRNFSLSRIEDNLPEVGWAYAMEFILKRAKESAWESDISGKWEALTESTAHVTKLSADPLSALRKAPAAFRNSSLFFSFPKSTNIGAPCSLGKRIREDDPSMDDQW
eukprot:CAMPEP_0198211700 /NCGR_PEP_ID=MMETSP1445-20131203/25195_1 /TAXON_ID=36898 /ORGANISM="Pyramimonas sp., Strain CCMP2087" /LENGTH=154 /DNA_ID=CAMNT_0043886023 /DNA_START=116 /DNA_END=577 /DNA_ORIENTATION=-